MLRRRGETVRRRRRVDQEASLIEKGEICGDFAKLIRKASRVRLLTPHLCC